MKYALLVEKNNSVQEIIRVKEQSTHSSSSSSGKQHEESTVANPSNIHATKSEAGLNSLLLEKAVVAAADAFEIMRESVYALTASISEVRNRIFWTFSIWKI